MSTDANDRSEKRETTVEPTPGDSQPTLFDVNGAASGDRPQVEAQAPSSPPSSAEAGDPLGATDAEQQAAQKRRILIGSQRDPAAYRARPKRDWTPIDEQGQAGSSKKDRRSQGGKHDENRAGAQRSPSVSSSPASASAVPPPVSPTPAMPAAASQTPPTAVAATPTAVAAHVADAPPSPAAASPSGHAGATAVSAFLSGLREEEELEEAESGLAGGKIPPRRGDTKVALPNIRAALSPDLEDEFLQALGDAPMDSLLGSAEEVSKQSLLEPESKQTGRVLAVHREDVFVELGGREQGVVPLLQFTDPPQPGQTIEVRVHRFNAEEGLYELALPHVAASIGDWSDLSEGMLVEAKVTGHNAGGLEAEVNHIRGFIPISQIAIYRVEQLDEFVGQSLPCLVVEANPDRRNLVLSHRAVLEREKEEACKLFWETLEVGQIREGVVRKLMDFGAFIDLGGADGLLHISQLAWGRVKHPSEVVQEGQTIRVRVDKIDPETRRIGLSYRDLMQSPWTDAERKYPVQSTVHGKVTKLMDFGAFVEIEPGVEGLVHISELAHKRVWRVSEVVKEGDEVDAVVLSIDTEAKRISLSMKSALPPEEPVAAEPDKDAAAEPPPPPKKKPTGPLRGGLGRSTGEQFGLKW
jgi:small subunit ribosomal protein S1